MAEFVARFFWNNGAHTDARVYADTLETAEQMVIDEAGESAGLAGKNSAEGRFLVSRDASRSCQVLPAEAAARLSASGPPRPAAAP